MRSRSRFSTDVAVLLLLAAVVWITHFLYSSSFGLYEDDWYRVAKVAGLSGTDFFSLLRTTFSFSATQGRPFHPALIYLLSYIGFKIGGLEFIYVIAFSILTANCILFYFLLKRFFPPRFAFLGAMAFATFPADTTQAFLTHALGIQPSILLLLVAMHLYLSARRPASYMCILLSLLMYETAFFVFMVVPFCVRFRKSEFVRHITIMATIFLCVVLVRMASTESHISHIGYRELLLGGANILAGPLTSLAMFVYRPGEVLATLSLRQGLILVSAALGVFTIAALRLHRAPVVVAATTPPQALLIGGMMLTFAYILTFTTVGIAVGGRGTRVHSAAILGASVICAWLCSTVLDRAISRYGRILSRVAIACFFTLLIDFGMNVQSDYVVGWKEEQGFWSTVEQLCPDIDDGTVIFVEPTGLRDTRQLLFLRSDLTGVPNTRQIKSLDSLYDVLPEIFKFPPSWTPPRVYRLPLNWRDNIFAGQGKLRVLSIEEGFSYVPTGAEVSSSRVIFLETKNGTLTRLGTLRDQAGTELELKSVPTLLPRLEETAIGRYLLLPPDQISDYLVK